MNSEVKQYLLQIPKKEGATTETPISAQEPRTQADFFYYARTDTMYVKAGLLFGNWILANPNLACTNKPISALNPGNIKQLIDFSKCAGGEQLARATI